MKSIKTNKNQNTEEENNLSNLDLYGSAVATTSAVQVVRQTRASRRLLEKSTSEGEELSDSSLMSAESTLSTATLATRKRLPTGSGSSGEGKPKKKSAKSLPTVGNDGFLEPLAPVAQARSKATLPSAEELGREMAAQPTAGLGSRIVEKLEAIEKVTDKPRNIKGSVVHEMRLAVRHIQAAVTEVIQRASSICLERENEKLRSQLGELGQKVEALKAELADLRQGASRSRPMVHQPPREQDYSEVLLMERIGNLIEGKLAAFKEEIFPLRVIRPPLGQKATPAASPQRPAENRKRSKTSTSGLASSPPDRSEGPGEETWSQVVGRKAKSKARRREAAMQELSKGSAIAPGTQKPVTQAAPTAGKASAKKGKAKLKPGRLPRVPKTAAVTITIPQDSTVTYAQAMSAAKERVKLADIGIASVKQRKALNGGLLLEIGGEECLQKANTLAAKIHEAVSDMGVRVARPVKQGEARVMDLDESVTQEDVANAIASAGGCSASEVKVGEIKKRRSSLGVAWVRCPLVTIHKLAAEKRVLVGWVSARVEVLGARPLQCFRCLEMGHARHQCTSSVDRSGRCFVCGEASHKANQCTAQAPKCMLCAESGRKADHRLGGKQCNPPKKKRGKGKDVSSVRVDGLAQGSTSASAHRPSEEMMEQA